jgi:hypothetical protein
MGRIDSVYSFILFCKVDTINDQESFHGFLKWHRSMNDIHHGFWSKIAKCGIFQEKLPMVNGWVSQNGEEFCLARRDL